MAQIDPNRQWLPMNQIEYTYGGSTYTGPFTWNGTTIPNTAIFAMYHEPPNEQEDTLKPSVVRTKAGYRGQVHYTTEILWEGPARKKQAKAQRDAERRIARGMARLVR